MLSLDALGRVDHQLQRLVIGDQRVVEFAQMLIGIAQIVIGAGKARLQPGGGVRGAWSGQQAIARQREQGDEDGRFNQMSHNNVRHNFDPL